MASQIDDSLQITPAQPIVIITENYMVNFRKAVKEY